MINRTNLTLAQLDSRPQIQNPRNMRGGALGGDVIHIGGDLYEVDVNSELSQYLDARKELFQRARNIIRNRVRHQIMRAVHGAAAVVYGIQFIYDARSEDWQGTVCNVNSFLEHITGIANTGKAVRDLNKEWVEILLNINNMESFIVHGDPRPGLT